MGKTLRDLIAACGWSGAEDWTAWASLGVGGRTLAVDAPDVGHTGMSRLTVPMAERIQGFADDWHFTGAKTNAYRQVGNAFPPPLAQAVSAQVAKALRKRVLRAVNG